MAAVAPLALDKDKDVRAAAVSTLQIMVARAVKEAEVTACDVWRALCVVRRVTCDVWRVSCDV